MTLPNLMKVSQNLIYKVHDICLVSIYGSRVWGFSVEGLDFWVFMDSLGLRF